MVRFKSVILSFFILFLPSVLCPPFPLLHSFGSNEYCYDSIAWVISYNSFFITLVVNLGFIVHTIRKQSFVITISDALYFFVEIHSSVCCYLTFSWRMHCNIFYTLDMLVMNSFSFRISEKVLNWNKLFILKVDCVHT